MSRLLSGDEIPAIPWENKPVGSADVVWRSTANPLITPERLPSCNGIYNSAVIPYQGEFRGVFRCDNRAKRFLIQAGHSRDALNWEIENKPISAIVERDGKESVHALVGYDPRVTRIEDRYIITWCNDNHGPTIGLAYSHDFETYYQLENAFLPFNRNGVLFPRKINGRYAMLSRPSDNAHTPFGDIFYSESPDLVFWGKHRHVMAPTGHYSWQSTKIGAGPIPIETDQGWLMIYHGVCTTCNGFVYSFGAALLDREKPWVVLNRTEPYLLAPERSYECMGNVANVVFPCAAMVDAATGRMAIYYGGADRVTCLAFALLDELIEYVKANSL